MRNIKTKVYLQVEQEGPCLNSHTWNVGFAGKLRDARERGGFPVLSVADVNAADCAVLVWSSTARAHIPDSLVLAIWLKQTA